MNHWLRYRINLNFLYLKMKNIDAQTLQNKVSINDWILNIAFKDIKRLRGKSKNEQHLIYFTFTLVDLSWALLHQDWKDKIFQDPSVQGTTLICGLPHSVDLLSTTIRVGTWLTWLCNFFKVSFSAKKHCFVRLNAIPLSFEQTASLITQPFFSCWISIQS